MVEEIEKLKLGNVEIKKLLDKNFMDKIEKLGEGITPISIVLIKIRGKMAIPLVISHENEEEVKSKIVHINSPDQNFLNKVKDMIKQSK